MRLSDVQHAEKQLLNTLVLFADSLVQTRVKNMADVVVTLKIMPDSPEENLDKIKEEALKKIKVFSGNDNHKIEIEPVAFGLNALKILFVMAEAKGSTDALEEQISKIKGVNSVEVTDVRRAIG
jgi:elongation factor 1-beta